jgi:hypothetical protein
MPVARLGSFPVTGLYVSHNEPLYSKVCHSQQGCNSSKGAHTQQMEKRKPCPKSDELTLHATRKRPAYSRRSPCLRLQHLGAAARVDCQSSEDVRARHLHSTAASSLCTVLQ